MAITTYTEPKDYGAGYSALPLRFDSDTDESKTYLVNVCYDTTVFNNAVPVSFNNQTYTKIDVNNTHDYKVGDVLLYYNEDNYTGIYTVMEVIDADEFIIDMVLEEPIITTNPSYFFRIVPYSLIEDPDGEAKLDLSNTLKDFVTQTFEDNVDPFDASSTRFDYLIALGEEYVYTFDFTDNAFITGGTVAFINPSLTSGDVDASPFKVGDRVRIQQDQQEWTYDSNYDSSGSLGFTSATDDHDFEVGQEIYITGQVTHPSYNGAVTITDVPTSKSIVVNKSFISATAAEPGSVFGTPVPSYNTTGTVTDIYWDVTNGYVLETDIEWVKSTEPIGGEIRFADNRKSRFLVEEQIIDKKIYNSHINKLDYSFDGDFDAYVVQNRTADSNKISTILAKSSTTRYRINRDQKYWLLVHEDGLPQNHEIRWTGYDSSGTIVSQLRIDNPSEFEDAYFPCWINNLPDITNTTILSGDILQATLDSIVEYKVEVESNGVVISSPVWFKVDVCSPYDEYYLCWKDSFGSWISFPFKYIQVNTTEYERKQYYQKEGTWNTTDDTYGFETYGRGDTQFFSRSRDKMRLSSDWVDESENELIKDLMGSPAVYVQDPDGNMLACVITDPEKTFPKEETDYLWNYVFNIKLARNENRF